MHLVIVTGMSGSGKTLAIRAFEDMGYFCIDNLPPKLLPSLRSVYEGSGSQGGNIAAVVDVRSGDLFSDLAATYPELSKIYKKVRVLFLDASDEALVQRFKETRRRHPLFAKCHGILESIDREREMLVGVKEFADKVVDTSGMEPARLKAEIVNYFGADTADSGLIITVSSFGFKWGVPLDADLVFDVRFLINPHYVAELRPFDGRDQPVEAYVMREEKTKKFLEKLHEFVTFSLPEYEREGKAYLNIAIGCTGGRHRSVVVAQELGHYLRMKGYSVITGHRDISKA